MNEREFRAMETKYACPLFEDRNGKLTPLVLMSDEELAELFLPAVAHLEEQVNDKDDYRKWGRILGASERVRIIEGWAIGAGRKLPDSNNVLARASKLLEELF